MKKCSFCEEEIKEESIFCPHCGEHLVAGEPIKQIKSKKPKWYFKNTSWIVGFLFVGPLVLPVVWTNPRYSVLVKIVITVIMLLITFGIIQLSLMGIQYLDTQYSDLLKQYY